MYHFNVPGMIIWISHILIGLILFYVGRQILDKKTVDRNIALVLLVTGPLAAVYHAHILYTHQIKNQ